MTSTVGLLKTSACSQCDGTGKVSHTYKYKPQHRSDPNSGNIDRQDVCSLCNGAGQLTQQEVDAWQQFQTNPVCPVCKGDGGKYYWSWDETENRTRKYFTFEPCSLCQGAKHVTAEQLAVHEREQRKLRFWGIGCTLLVVVGGLFGATQLIYLLLAKTPWVQCCAPPHVVLVTGLIVVSRKMGWFQ